MARKTTDHFSGNRTTDSGVSEDVSAPERVSEEIKPGFFYRVKSKVDEDPDQVIGVYAKSVKYCGDKPITKGKVFEAIRDHVFEQKREKTNYLGACFFGIWSFRRKGKIKCRTVQVPVTTSESGAFSCIWKTGHTKNETKIGEEKRKFEHMSCKGDHTEVKAITLLMEQQTQKALWSNFLEQTLHKKVPQNERILDCIGIHFFSKLDACDECLRCLVAFQKQGMEFCPPRMSHEVDTVGDRVPFVITFTSQQLYHPELRNFKDPRDNKVHSASLLFTHLPCLLRLGGIKGKSNPSYGYMVESELYIKHQDSVCLDENEEFDFVVLMVNNGTPVKVK